MVIVVASGCAPLPGPGLFPGLEHTTPLAEVLVIEEIGLVSTTATCTELLYDAGHYGFLAANALLNAGMVFGCATAHWDESGIIRQCNVYIAFDWEFLREHELKHCMGFDDVY